MLEKCSYNKLSNSFICYKLSNCRLTTKVISKFKKRSSGGVCSALPFLYVNKQMISMLGKWRYFGKQGLAQSTSDQLVTSWLLLLKNWPSLQCVHCPNILEREVYCYIHWVLVENRVGRPNLIKDYYLILYTGYYLERERTIS